MVLSVTFAIAVLVSGIVLLALSSDKAVEHSVQVAYAMGFSSLMIGLILVSLGTDLPEIANSIIACWSGHGDIDVGDSFGSILTQITLVLGLIALFGRSFKVSRKEILILGAFEVLALFLSFAVALTGFSREKAFLLIASWPVFIFVIRRLTAADISRKRQVVKSQAGRHYAFHLVMASLGFVGIAIGALAVVQSVILLSSELGVPEFLISFFAVGIGTSLPELVVDFTAVRKRQYQLALGDIIGSCIVDATVSISIGQFLFPTPVFVQAPGKSISLVLFAILASAIVISVVAARRKIDRRSGVFFIVIYSLSYAIVSLV
ncbi:MAG: sodium:calcium antiporter [Candidatus Bathyarchaeota archaeon]|nr:MAG: sodium:calcium antiporter [Candidatus Bathyarchaeota archaeon]